MELLIGISRTLKKGLTRNDDNQPKEDVERVYA
jgi:hypothetical protein